MKKSIILTLLVILFATLTLFAQQAGSIQDQQACEYARRSNRAEIWQDYLEQFPQGMCSFEAKSVLKMNGKGSPQCSKFPCKDQASGYMWSSPSGKDTWKNAKKYCDTLAEGGYSNWHLPTLIELESLVGNKNVTSMFSSYTGWFWSSTPNGTHYWTLNIWVEKQYSIAPFQKHSVICVRK